MPLTGTTGTSLCPGRFDYKRLAWAFAISLAVHLAGYGGYKFTKESFAGMDAAREICGCARSKAFNHPKPPTPPHPERTAAGVCGSESLKRLRQSHPKIPNIIPSQICTRLILTTRRKPIPLKLTVRAARRQDRNRAAQGGRSASRAAPAGEAHPEEQAKPKPVIGDLATVQAGHDLAAARQRNGGTNASPPTLADAKTATQ